MHKAKSKQKVLMQQRNHCYRLMIISARLKTRGLVMSQSAKKMAGYISQLLSHEN